MEPFYEHGSTVDLFALCGAFEVMQILEEPYMRERAALVETVLLILGIHPEQMFLE
jgi:hypothetical protein